METSSETHKTSIVNTLLEFDKPISKALSNTWKKDKKDENGQRQQYRRAVEKHLDQIVAVLLATGFGLTGKKEHKRRRRIDSDLWATLGNAADLVDVSRPSLLRACLRLQYALTPDQKKTETDKPPKPKLGRIIDGGTD